MKKMTAPASGKIGKIIWAVDPFTEDKSLQKNTAWALRSLAKNEVTEIEPVYSLGAYPGGFPYEGPKDLTHHVALKAQDELEELLRRVRLPGLKPVKVLMGPTDTLSGRVDRLVAYAQESGARLIVASTRARKGLGRWLTGSFAENLILRSDVPLFLVNPSWDRASDLRKIVFPTDFSEESREAFAQVIELATAIKGRITVYHKISFDLNPSVGIALAAYPPMLPLPPETYDNEVRARKAEAQQWAEEAEKAGVRADSFVDGRLTGSPSEAILRFSKERPGLIAMAARSGRLATVLLGSTTRKVVKSATAPVWIVHTPHRLSDLREYGKKSRAA